MEDTVRSEYRITLHRDQPRAIRRAAARGVIQRGTHQIVLQVTDGGVNDLFHPDWWYDLRRKQLRVYGALLRFIDVSVLRRVPKSVLKLIPKWIDAYIEDAYDGDGDDHPSTTAKAA